MAEKGPYPPPSAPQGGFPEAPPSYEATVSGTAGKKNVRLSWICKLGIVNTYLFNNLGGFVDPNQSQPKPMMPPPQQQRAPGAPAGVAGGAAPAQTVIVQYMNPPNFGPNPVR